VNEAIFFCREDMRPDGEVIIVTVNKFEREHGILRFK
jgi:hypothetical protein